jgi:hypothetical protein
MITVEITLGNKRLRLTKEEALELKRELNLLFPHKVVREPVKVPSVWTNGQYIKTTWIPSKNRVEVRTDEAVLTKDQIKELGGDFIVSKVIQHVKETGKAGLSGAISQELSKS